MGRELTDSERETAEFILDVVSQAIAEEFDVPEPAPSVVKMVCVEKVVGALNNPQGLATFSEQLGSYQRSGTFPRAADIGIFLSEQDRRAIRRAVGSIFKAIRLATPYSGDEE